MSEEKIEKVFQVTGQARLVVKNIRGSVRVSPGQKDVIQVSAVKHSESGDAHQTVIELIQDADGTINAITRFPNGSIDWLFGRQPCKVDYVIQAPHNSSIKLSGVSDDVDAGGFEGEFSFNTVSGEISLYDINGPLTLHTISGDVTGKSITGCLNLDTVSGNIYLKDANITSIKAKTVSGDLHICTSLQEGPYDLNSVSGNGSFHLPPETRCLAELHSISGDILSAFPVTACSQLHGNQSIAIHGGGVKISMHSVSGNLSLDCDGVLPANPEKLENLVKQDRRKILDRIERGELTVEEALIQLQ